MRRTNYKTCDAGLASAKRYGGAGYASTLVEVLIAVAILGILAAIILPGVQGHVQKAKESAATDNQLFCMRAPVFSNYFGAIFSKVRLIVVP
jgi:prepilin-type N-terminal cleavage/methylation domain-containing protein